MVTTSAVPQGFNWNVAGVFKNLGGNYFDPTMDDHLDLFSPEDNVHGFLLALLGSASRSIVINMYGYDDSEIDALLLAKAASPNLYFQMSLDKSQAGGVTEKELLSKWAADIGNSIAIGESSKHAISHLKVAIIDGIYTITGSTNWSMSGEQKQDNQLTAFNLPRVAAEYRAILDINHAEMLRQMAAAKATG